MTKLKSVLALVLLLGGCSSAGPVVPSLGVGDERLAAAKDKSTLLRLGDSARAAGDAATAVGLYRRAAADAAKDPVPFVRLGGAFADLQAYTDAAEAYRNALELAPDDADAHRGLGTVLLSLGKPALALEHFETARRARQDDPRLYNAIGVAQDLLGRHEAAQQSYAAGLRIAPTHAGLRNNLGLSQALGGDFAGAAATLSGLAAGPGATPRHRLNLALVYGLAGDGERAGEIARTDLDDIAVRNNLAYYALLRGMTDQQRAAAILGIQATPRDVALAPAAIAQAPEPVAVPAPAPEAVAAAPLPPVAEPAPVRAPLPVAEPVVARAAAPAPTAVALDPPPAPSRPAPEAAAAPERPRAPRTVAALPGPYLVQAGAFRLEATAQAVGERLSAAGLPFSVVAETRVSGKPWYFVRSTVLPTHAEASELAQRVRAADNPAILVAAPPSPLPDTANLMPGPQVTSMSTE